MSERTKAAAPAKAAPVATRVLARAPMLARKCSCAPGDPNCKQCADDDKKRVQRKASSAFAARTAVPSVVHNVLGMAGRPLDGATRQLMESRLGHDFGGVRIHTGGNAAESARSVGALAYTVGSHIVFGDGQYEPASERGQRLLAHELAHTIQQRGVDASALDAMETSSPGDAYEREADAIAEGAMSGAAVHPSVTRGVQPMLSRAAAPQPVSNPQALTRLDRAGLMKLGEITDDDPTGEKVIHRYLAGELRLPDIKGKVEEFYRQQAEANALETIVANAGRFRSVLKAERSDTPDLRRFWLSDAGIPLSDEEAKRFLESSKTATGVECQVDHKIELHIGGADAPSNVQLLTGRNNNDAQAAIRKQITATATFIRNALKDAGEQVDEIALRYNSVRQQPPAVCDDCCQYEDQIRARVKEAAEKDAKKGKKDDPPGDLVPYPIKAAAVAQTLQVAKNIKIPTTIENDPQNNPAAGLIPGLRLQTLYRNNETHTITARIENEGGNDPKKTRVPIVLKNEANPVTLNVIGGVVKFATGAPARLKFVYPYLSEGTITKLSFEQDGLHAKGTIRPSIPLLNKVVLDVAYAPGVLTASLKPSKELPSVIPGLTLTDPKLTFDLLPEFKPAGSVNFHVGTKTRPLLDGTLEVGVDGTDLTAEAKDVNAHIPGLDDAKGNVKYHRTRGWTSDIHLKASSKPLVSKAVVDVSLSDEGINASGAITVKPPGGSEVDLRIDRTKDGDLRYSGEGEVKIPRLEPVKLKLGYSRAGLSASGSAPFKLFDTKGELEIAYAKGAFTGSVQNFAFKKGRALVTIKKLSLNSRGKFTGEGGIELPLGNKFTATGSVKLDENENLSITAALKIAKPIELFPPIKGDYKFFTIELPIPIPGASIGDVGLVAKIIGSLSAGYSIGPATLEEAELAAGIDPLKEGGPEVRFKARLVMPASAYVTGSITGEVALDVLVAEVAGGLTLTVKASLDATSSVETSVLYTPKRFSFDGELKARLELLLAVALEAFVKARAGISVFSVDTEKRWTLGRVEFKPGGALTLQANLHYASDEKFEPPTINFNKPEIDSKKLVSTPFDKATPTEKEV